MSERPLESYKIGDPLVTTGEKIEEIVGQSNSSGVYITVGGIRWEYYAGRSVPDRLQPAIKRFEQVGLIARRTFRKGKRKDVRRELANALRAALETPRTEDPLEPLLEVEGNFSKQYVGKAAIQYVCGSLVSVLVLVGVAHAVRLWGPEEARLVATGGIAGAIGSLISVLIRIRTIEASAAPLWYWSIEGSLRSLLGVIFGSFLVILIRANVVLGLVSQNSFANFTIAMVGGFSERLVPNILRKLEEEQIGATRRGHRKKSEPKEPD